MERIIGYGEGYTIHELYTMHPQFLSGKQVHEPSICQTDARYQIHPAALWREAWKVTSKEAVMSLDAACASNLSPIDINADIETTE